jgi:hypothetical protein
MRLAAEAPGQGRHQQGEGDPGDDIGDRLDGQEADKGNRFRQSGIADRRQHQIKRRDQDGGEKRAPEPGFRLLEEIQARWVEAGKAERAVKRGEDFPGGDHQLFSAKKPFRTAS